MSKYRKIVVAFFFILSSQDVIAELQGKYWIVNSGDTLYGIARSIFPGNASLQSKLRIEIINLNQKVFKKGSGSLYIGAELVLPEFALSQLPPVQSSQIKSHSKVSRKPKTTTSQKTSSHFLLENNEWRVKRGDTLYSIARVFYPKSSRTQYKLRKDIVNLNPTIFSGGMNNMEIGLVLLMPDYVVKADEPVNEIVAVPLEAEPAVIDTQVEIKADKSISEPVSEEEIHASEVEADRETDIEPVSVSEKPDKHYGVTNYNNKQFSSQVSMNFGYSSGGDIAVAATGGSDVEFGGGGHLRLSYDGLWKNKQGYRLSLGYELGQVTAGSDSGELEQTYLQAMYIYNTSDSLSGIGISYHDNILRTTDISAVVVETNYEPAAGLVMMYEYKRLFGDHIVGVSYTQLESENSATQAKVDMSRTEIYYRWAF